MKVTPPRLSVGEFRDRRFLRACRGESVDMTPVWFMRQAGRYMAEYQAIRAHYSLLEICADPRLAAEVTLQPVRALGVDAAIIFADILLPAVPLGLGLDFVANEGPVIPNPLRSPEAVAALPNVDPVEAFGPTLEAISVAVVELDSKTPLIGFAGAPFTLASYLIEGGPTRRFLHTKRLLRSDPATWRQLMEKLAGMTADYLIAQVDAGATALQLFDTWAGVPERCRVSDGRSPLRSSYLRAAGGDRRPHNLFRR